MHTHSLSLHSLCLDTRLPLEADLLRRHLHMYIRPSSLSLPIKLDNQRQCIHLPSLDPRRAIKYDHLLLLIHLRVISFSLLRGNIRIRQIRIQPQCLDRSTCTEQPMLCLLLDTVNQTTILEDNPCLKSPIVRY